MQLNASRGAVGGVGSATGANTGHRHLAASLAHICECKAPVRRLFAVVGTQVLGAKPRSDLPQRVIPLTPPTTAHCCVSLHAAPCCAALHAAHELLQVAAAERRLLAVLPMLSAVECSMGCPMQASATTTGEDLLMHEAQSGAR